MTGRKGCLIRKACMELIVEMDSQQEFPRADALDEKIRNWITNQKNTEEKVAKPVSDSAAEKKTALELVKVFPPRLITSANFAPQIAKKMSIEAGTGTTRAAINSHMAAAYRLLRTDSELQVKAQEYADALNNSHFIKNKRIFKHYRKAIQKCHSGIEEAGGNIISFGIIDDKCIFSATGTEAIETVKILKRKGVDLTKILNGIRSLRCLQNLQQDLGELYHDDVSVERKRKQIKLQLQRKYRKVFPDSKAVPYSKLTLESLIGWPDVEWARHKNWNKSELDLIQEALPRIEFKKQKEFQN